MQYLGLVNIIFFFLIMCNAFLFIFVILKKKCGKEKNEMVFYFAVELYRY